MVSPFGNGDPATPDQNGEDGTANTGGGGGGSGYNTNSTYRRELKGGTGGSGIILLEELISRRLQLFETKVFTSSTTFTTQATKADYLIVAGGGGGGNDRGTGGGAGGVRIGTGLALQKGVEYTINIGSGGSAGAPVSPRLGGQGGGSYIEAGTFHLGTNGGGAGSKRTSPFNPTTYNGGCGAGTPIENHAPGEDVVRSASLTLTTANGHNELLDASLGITSQGFDGGLCTSAEVSVSSGGGGAGSIGEDVATPFSARAANGGSAISYTYNGITQTFAAGGAGGRFVSPFSAEKIEEQKGFGCNGGGGDFTLRGGGGNGGATGNPSGNPLNDDAQSGTTNTGGVGGGGGVFIGGLVSSC